MKVLGIIPARLAATRFPNKPMVDILGIPMIGHCLIRSRLSKLLDEVYVATCDSEIYNYVESIGGKAIMTSDKHERASERTAEALMKIEISLKTKFDVIVMIQGDEPLVRPIMIEDLLLPFNDNLVDVSNLMIKLSDFDEVQNPNNVKVVFNSKFKALYMSREAIPSCKKYSFKDVTYYRQLGLIAFRRDALLEFEKLNPSQLEVIESVDMNRLFESNISIQMVLSNLEVDAVDTPEDLERVENKMRNDELFLSYKNEYK